MFLLGMPTLSIFSEPKAPSPRGFLPGSLASRISGLKLSLRLERSQFARSRKERSQEASKHARKEEMKRGNKEGR